ncbi:MAG: MBL fold metallo-hydrolase [bacterium]
MKITKFGHCCLLIEESGVRVITDPGSYTETQNEIKNVDVILISHEHQDHFHVPSIKKILENNPNATIITNTSVCDLLIKEGIDSAKIVEDGNSFEVKGLSFEAFGKDHAVIYKEMGLVENTGYFVGKRLFYPGDSFYDPKRPVDILATPFAGPWMKISEAIEYVLSIGPKKCFPVHDGGLNLSGMGFSRRVAPIIFQKSGIEFIPLEINTETEI